MREFKLSDSFMEAYKVKEVDWGPLGEVVYLRTYSRKKENGSNESWWETVQRVVEGCYSIQKEHCDHYKLPWKDTKAQRSAQIMYDKIFNFKFTPSGRGLFQMGTDFVKTRGAMSLLNCFAYDTEIITNEGIKKIGEVSGTNQVLLVKEGKWVSAPIRNFGKQELYKLTLVRQSIEKVIYTTKNHRWFAKDRRHEHRDKGFVEFTTENLRPGIHKLQYMFGQGVKQITASPFGIAHGFFFGDGHKVENEKADNNVRLCGDKDLNLLKYYSECQLRKIENDVVVCGIPNYFKNAPSLTETKSYLYGWLAGYFAADGSCYDSGRSVLVSYDRTNLEFVRDVCYVIGIGTYGIREETRISNLTGREHAIYSLSFINSTLTSDFFVIAKHKENFIKNESEKNQLKNWKVVSIEPTGVVEDVYCATVDGYGAFTLADNILTGNCATSTTSDLNTNGSFAFTWAMDALMLGVGVSADTLGAGKITIRRPRKDGVFQIPDSREGWVDSLRIVLDGYFEGKEIPDFDYSIIRPYGSPIGGFGGVASGPDPLRVLHEGIRKLLDSRIGNKITSTDIADMMDMIGVCVVAGNVRRSAILMLGDWDDKEYTTMKDPTLHSAELSEFRWASNNSIKAEVGKTDYKEIAKGIIKNGEPGLVWIDNIRTHGRMADAPDTKDKYVVAVNPCQPAWAKVLTPNGIMNLGDITIGDNIWSKDGWTTVENKWSTGVKKVYKYQTSANVFYGTENHRVISNGEKIEIKDAETIEVLSGMYKTDFTIDPQDVLDGLVIGDGMVHKASGNKVLLCIGENDSDYFRSEIRDLITESRFGISPYAYDIQTSITYDELPRVWERRVPDRFIYNPNKAIGFLRGLYSANGCVVDNRIQLKATSRDLIEDVQMMLSSLGIRSYTTTNKPSSVKFNNGEFVCKESYDLNVTVDRNKFINLIGFIQDYKNEKIQDVTSHYKKDDYEIISTELVSEEEVYDITVDNTSHTYWTQGCNVSNCGEIVLEDKEMCNLVECFPSRHDTFDEFRETLKYAYLYAKTVTLIPTHVPETNAVMMKNRRLGISQSGIIDAFAKHGRRTMMIWNNDGYNYLKELDELYSNWFCIPRSIRITTCKPSGSVALLPGVSAGIHYPHSEYYIRNIRMASSSPLVQPLMEAGYEWDYSKYGMDEEEKKKTLVFSFPVHEKYFIKGKEEASIWEQIKNAVDYQRYWSDNSVSITVTFNKEEAKDIPLVLEAYEDSLKAISFLPIEEHGYVQAPYITIDHEKYIAMSKDLKKPNFSSMLIAEEAKGEKYCSSEKCDVV